MSDDESGHGDELKAMRKENLRLARRVRQLERMTRNSEQMTKQSKAAHRLTVTALEQHSSELQEATDRAETAALAKDLFLATMSHEIRTPMNGVIGCIELIDQERLDAEQRGVVTTLQSSARALMLLLNDVLDFAKIEGSQTTLEATPFSIHQLLDELCQIQGMSAAERGVTVEFCVESSLHGSFIGDPHRLRQIFNNLVGNAVKFTEDGVVAIHVAPSTCQGRVQFRVVDSGIGMHEAALKSIFEPFRQADESTTRRFGGTGLGLAICKALVTAMGGELRVESEFGVGSTFSFEIELSRAALGQGASGTERRERPLVSHCAPELAGLDVLLVDDNPVNRLVGEKLLARMGCVVATASGGVEAVGLASEASWDVILMDCSMPEVDGYEATKRIRRLPAPWGTVPVIALTAFAMPGDREKSISAGMSDHLTKPLDVERIRAVLAGITERPRAA